MKFCMEPEDTKDDTANNYIPILSWKQNDKFVEYIP